MTDLEEIPPKILKTSDGTEWKWERGQLYIRPPGWTKWTYARTTVDDIRAILSLWDEQ